MHKHEGCQNKWLIGKFRSFQQAHRVMKLWLTCMMRRISVLFWKSYSRLKWIWPTFSLGSELSIYMSTKEMDLLCRNAFCNTHRRYDRYNRFLSGKAIYLGILSLFLSSERKRDWYLNAILWKFALFARDKKSRTNGWNLHSNVTNTSYLCRINIGAVIFAIYYCNIS